LVVPRSLFRVNLVAMRRLPQLPMIPVILMLTMSCSLEPPAQPARDPSQDPAGQDRAATLVSKGVAAMEHGDSAAAKIFFRRALSVDSKNLAGRTYLGILADKAGELAEAERQFAAAAAAAPKSPEARNNYGAILLKLGRKRQAAVQFEASLQLDQRQPGALVNLAQIRFSSGTPAGLREARELFRRAQALAPDAETARALVVIALQLHEPEQAGSDFHDYSARMLDAPQSVSAPAARAELGAALLEQGLSWEAAQELQAAVAAQPSNVNDVVLLARALQANKTLPAAGRVLESAIARGMEAAPIYLTLVEIYEAEGRVENAIPAMRRAIELDPKNEAYRFRYAMLLTDTNAPQAAVIRLREALNEFPNSAKLWFAMGIAQLQDNKNEEAAQSFDRCVQLDPTMSAAFAYLGMIDVDLGKVEAAVAFYKKALDVNGHSAAAHFLMAEALGKLTPPNEPGVEEHLKRALSVDPKFQQAHLALGKLLSRTNRFEDAARELEEVIQADPKMAEAYYQLGRVYMRLKRKEDAQVVMSKFEQLSDAEKKKSEDERREIVRRLAEVRF